MRESAGASDAGEAWAISADPIHGSAERGWRARLTLSNGFLGAQASSPIWNADLQADRPHAYVAGLFEGPEANLADRPDRLVLTLEVDGRVLPLERGALAWRRMLDMRRGLLALSCDPGPDSALGHLRTLRLLSMDDRRLDFQLAVLGFVRNADATLEAHWRTEAQGALEEDRDDAVCVWRYDRHTLARASHARLRLDGRLLEPERTPEGWRWRWRSRSGQTASFEGLSALARGDDSTSNPKSQAIASRAAALDAGRVDIIARHQEAWEERWACSQVEIDGDPEAQRALRFALYHLNSAANPDDAAVSIGARGLTGDAYAGHAFWDTEAFLLAFYTLTWPAAARTLLAYRYRCLEGARSKAAGLGWRGAFYAWESADTGEEAAPQYAMNRGRRVDIPTGRDELHISADVALAVWRYWRATGDDDFFRDEGAEILLETARFWASCAALEIDGARHIRSVEGPDEYHHAVDDNAYTNVMARWNLRRGVETAAILSARWPERAKALSASLRLGPEELAQWKTVADTLVTGLDRRTGVYRQFQGFFNLERIDLSKYADRDAPMDVVLGQDRIGQTQVIKQPDVLALLARLPDLFGRERGLANFHTYAPLCSHGSSLSAVTHALVAARLDERDTALRYFRMATDIDVGPDASRSAGGVHFGALGGLWQTTVFGFAGMSARGGAMVFDPRLPRAWTSLAFPIRWRDRSLRVLIEPEQFLAVLEEGEPMPMRVAGRSYLLKSEAPLIVPLRS